MYDLKELIHSIDGGVVVIDKNLVVSCWNDWLKNATNITQDYAVGKKLEDIIQIEPIKLSALKRNIKTSLTMNIITFMTPQTYGYLFKVPLKNPFLTTFEHMQQEVKIITLNKEEGIIGIFISDHTAVMDTRVILQKEKQKLEDILHAQNEILFLTDGFDVKLANKKFLDFFGFSSIQEYTNSANCFGHFFENVEGCFSLKCEKPEPCCKWHEEMSKLENHKRFVAIKDKNGELSYFIVQIATTSTPDNYIVTLTDATKEFLYQQELEKKVEEETEKRLAGEHILTEQSRYAMLGEMIGATAHQLKQPLNAIRMLASDMEYTLMSESQTSDQLGSDIKMIYSQVDHMNATITSFRNFLAPSSATQYFSINNAINSVTLLLSGLLKESNIEISVEISKMSAGEIINCSSTEDTRCSPICVLGKEIEFKQVLINLISNTRDALREISKVNAHTVGTVIIQITHTHDDCVTMKYRDNAGGIPVEILKSMFKPYNTSKSDLGTGIGMYISKRIIEKMGGTITVANVGSGALFTITMKAYENEYLSMMK